MSTSTQVVKAWLYTTTSYPNTLTQNDYDTPTSPPTPTSVTIKPHAVSLNPVDIQLMNLPLNDLPASTPMLGNFSGPKVAGRDFSGVIIASGPDTRYKPGDAVCGINMSVPGTGFLAERIVLDLDPSGGANIIPKSSHLSHVQAASLPCVYLTANTTIDKCIPYCTAEPASSNKLVVLGGSSSTGIYTIRLAKLAGWTVLSSCSTQKIEFVKSRGADEVVDYTTSPTAVSDAVRMFNPSAIIDCVGGTDCIGLAPQYVSIVGDKTSRDTMGGSALYWTNPTMVVRWLAGWLGVGKGYECIVLDNRRDWLEEINKVKADEVVIDSVFGFESVKEAFERLDTGRARGKVVVKIVEDGA